MIIRCICFTEKGRRLLEKLEKSDCEYEFQCFIKSSGQAVENSSCNIVSINESTTEFAGRCFEENYPLVFVGATGIAVRSISPFISDKLHDIPVLVIDDCGQFVIPILSGHVGGANELARRLAEIIGAEPVITTSTDNNAAFAPDMLAMEHNLTIANRGGIKKVAGKSLEGKPVTICIKNYPPEEPVDIFINNEHTYKKSSEVSAALVLESKEYVLGIGCKKGKAFQEIEAFVNDILTENNLDISQIYAICSIELKVNEPGIKEFSRKYRIPFITFDAELLNKAPGTFSESQFVKNITGTDNVCERSAVLGAGYRGKLVVSKCARDGITLGIAKRYLGQENF